jgi:hypothetical protein
MITLPQTYKKHTKPKKERKIHIRNHKQHKTNNNKNSRIKQTNLGKELKTYLSAKVDDEAHKCS